MYSIGIKALIAAVLLVSVASAQANDRAFGLYAGVGGGLLYNRSSNDAFGKDINFKVAEVLGGLYIGWFGIETRLGEGLVEETLFSAENPNTGASISSKSKIESYESVYVRLQYANDIARIYVLLGQTELTAINKPEGGTFSQSFQKGDAYGIGAGVYVSKSINFNVELKYLLKNEVSSYTQTSFNIDFMF